MEREIFIALGLLSTAGGFGYGRSSGKQSRIRRDKLREMRRSMHAPGVALRFLLARPQRATRLAAACHDRKKGWSAACATADRGVASELAAAHAEQREFSDLVFLNATEHFFRCPLKYVLWLRVAPTLFPAARFVALGDDDVFVAFHHLEADLRIAHALGGPRALSLWGLITWKAYTNNATMDTSTGFTGWASDDGGAVRLRRKVEACRDALLQRELRVASRHHRSQHSIAHTVDWHATLMPSNPMLCYVASSAQRGTSCEMVRAIA